MDKLSEHLAVMKWVYIYIGVMALLSMMSGDNSGALSFNISVLIKELVSKVDATEYSYGDINRFVRHLTHFVEYFVLIQVLNKSLVVSYGNRRFNRLYLLLIGVSVSLCDEWVIQRYLTTGRTPSFYDMLIDLSGIVLALWSIGYLRRMYVKDEEV